MPKSAELLPGTLDLLILKAVSLGKLHGYAVLLRIEQISGGSLHIQQGALYPALYRLEQQGLIDSEQSARKVLPPDARGPAAPPGRIGQLAALCGRHGSRAPHETPGDLK
jgi:Transcriptional regulator PadR-like family